MTNHLLRPLKEAGIDNVPLIVEEIHRNKVETNIELRAEVQRLKKENEELKVQLVNNEDLQKQIDFLRKRNNELERELEKVNNYCSKFQMQKQKLEKLSTDFVANQLSSSTISQVRTCSEVDSHSFLQQTNPHTNRNPSQHEMSDAFTQCTTVKRPTSDDSVATSELPDSIHNGDTSLLRRSRSKSKRNAYNLRNIAENSKSSTETESSADLSLHLQNNLSSFSFSEDSDGAYSSKNQKKKKRRKEAP